MYKIIDTKKRCDVAGTFARRELAKVDRNKLNAKFSDPKAKPRYVVGRSKDHPRGETDGFDHTSTSRWS